MAMKMGWLLQSVPSCIMSCRPSGREHIGISVGGYRVDAFWGFPTLEVDRGLVQWVDDVVEACPLGLWEWESNFWPLVLTCTIDLFQALAESRGLLHA